MATFLSIRWTTSRSGRGNNRVRASKNTEILALTLLPPLSKAVILLCAAKKSRDADHLHNFVYDQCAGLDADKLASRIGFAPSYLPSWLNIWAACRPIGVFGPIRMISFNCSTAFACWPELK